jgi:uncharacterized protein DUF3995
MRRMSTLVTVCSLGGIAALHAAWGAGSTFPFRTRDELNDTVIGRAATPSAGACYGVAGLLAAAAALVGGFPGRSSRLRRTGVGTVAVVLAARGALGFAGKTDLVSPGSTSEHFRNVDRRYFSPLCLALAAGATASLRD